MWAQHLCQYPTRVMAKVLCPHCCDLYNNIYALMYIMHHDICNDYKCQYALTACVYIHVHNSFKFLYLMKQ